jgi:DHA1 family tetracycline resistance protein-like MFS transporter
VTARGSTPRVRLLILFLTVFIDLVGFGIVLPLLPIYADRFGASGVQIGILVLSYSGAQLLLGPVWGRLSDRFGRRPILVLGLVGSAVSYLLFAYAGTLAMLLLSRIMAGVWGANIPVAQAYVADITTPEERAGGMGLLGAAFGLGFIFGPALGGLMAPISPAAPGLAAAALCATNALLAIFFLPESLPRRARLRRTSTRGLGRPGVWVEAQLVFRSPRFLSILSLSFLFVAGFSVMHPVFPLFVQSRFGLDERAVGWLFAFMGLGSAVTQGAVVRKLVPRIGEDGMVRLSALPFVGGLLLMALAQNVGVLLVALTLLAFGFGGVLPALSSLLSRAAPDALQGSSLGIGQSVGALARMAGPLAGGLAWDVWGGGGPFFLGAGIVAVAALGVFVGPRWSVARPAPTPATAVAPAAASSSATPAASSTPRPEYPERTP